MTKLDCWIYGWMLNSEKNAILFRWNLDHFFHVIPFFACQFIQRTRKRWHDEEHKINLKPFSSGEKKTVDIWCDPFMMHERNLNQNLLINLHRISFLNAIASWEKMSRTELVFPFQTIYQRQIIAQYWQLEKTEHTFRIYASHSFFFSLP